MTSVSQSVVRSFDVFRLFADRRTALTAVEIAEHLQAPRSSVAALLKALVELRMVSLNRRTLTYLPTLGFAQLGAWLTDPAHFPPHVAEVMASLQRDCGETVTASWPLENEMEIIRVERSRLAISFVAEIGQRLPLWSSAVGAAYLASLSNSQIAARWEKDRRRLDGLPPIDEVLAQVSDVRNDGVAIVHSGVFEGASALASIVNCEHDGRPMVVSIAGPEGRIHDNEADYRAALLHAIAAGGLSP